ncbi:DNA-processing protein DprA [bacterium]|nr:DNA-processing protein DprA [bacterium]
MTKNSYAWIALNSIAGVGPVLSRRLAEQFGSAGKVFAQPSRYLAAMRHISPELAERICGTAWEQVAEEELKKSRACGARIVTLEEKTYPAVLRSIDFSPPVLYVLGNWLPEDSKALAVVGSRRPSAYGITATKLLVRDLVRQGLTIVSGLALGIDTQAHMTALQNNGRTLAVVAHGLSHVYPPENKELWHSIARQGAVISEFPMAQPAVPQLFPRRNRVISGLSQGVLVVEARVRSGALITARWASEQGKDVFAVPGSFQSSLSQGTHALIQDGAKLVTQVEDILQELPKINEKHTSSMQPNQREKAIPLLSPENQKICQALESGALHIDQLLIQCQLPLPALLESLLSLELQGMVQCAPGQFYHWVGEKCINVG